jgi:hypothetical protein
MKKIKISTLIALALLLLFAVNFASEKQTSVPAEPATGEEINWQVISSGGTDGASTNFVLKGTLGQTTVGYGSSANYGLSHGFWQELGGGGCCNHDGIRGDVDMGGSINVGDIAYLVDYLFSTPPGPVPPCFEEADVDAGGSINVGDVAYLVAYLFATPSGPAPLAC